MTGFGMTLPVLPFYIEQISIADGVTQNKLWMHVGLITGIYPFVQFLISPLLGTFSDKIGRKPLIVAGLAGYAVSIFLFGMSKDIFMLYLFRSFSGIFSAAFFTSALSYLTDNTTEDKRGSSMSLLISVAGLGSVTGPLIGSLLSTAGSNAGYLTFDHFSFPFLFSAIMTLLVCCFLSIFLKEPIKRNRRNIMNTNNNQSLSFFVSLKSFNKAFVSLLVLSFLSQLSLALFQGTFALHSQRILAFGRQEMNTVFIVCSGVIAVLQLGPVSWLIKTKGEIKLIPIGLTLLGAGMGLLMISGKIDLVLLFVSFIAGGMAILTPCLASLISKNSGKNNGAAMGVYSSVNNLGQMLGVVTGSILMIWFFHLPYLIIAFVLLSIAYLFITKFRFDSDLIIK
ncbi:MAG: MFS transporter [Chitinophagaceae bacterium]|nr:MFS transporter [Chitinophagaceae bacterium]